MAAVCGKAVCASKYKGGLLSLPVGMESQPAQPLARRQSLSNVPQIRRNIRAADVVSRSDDICLSRNWGTACIAYLLFASHVESAFQLYFLWKTRRTYHLPHSATGRMMVHMIKPSALMPTHEQRQQPSFPNAALDDRWLLLSRSHHCY
jgi:hypothetical protein